MRRIPVLTFLALLVLPASAQADLPVKPPKLAVKVTTCATGTDASDRTAVFTGSMPRLASAATMAMRFDLYERAPGDAWKRIDVANFGEWERSAPNVAGFIFDKRVEELAAPASYRVVVRYRWYSASGKIVQRERRTSSTCAQPDLRPDLVVERIDVSDAGDPDVARYVVSVRNAGRSAARSPFTVGLTVNGTRQAAQSLAALEPGRVAKLTFLAPRCAPGSAVRAEVDVDRGVDEADEADNTAVEPCEEP